MRLQGTNSFYLMIYLNSSQLQLIGQGANGKVYRVPTELSGLPIPAVVKTCRLGVKRVLDNYEAVCKCGVNTLCFMQECVLDGYPALLMEDLFTEEKVFVSPNSIRNGHLDNEPENYLQSHKITSISNYDILLLQLSDLVTCASNKGIELLVDTIFFGVERNALSPSLTYKIVDLDGMIISLEYGNQVRETNVVEIKWALSIFIESYVSDRTVAAHYIQQLQDYAI